MEPLEERRKKVLSEHVKEAIEKERRERRTNIQI